LQKKREGRRFFVKGAGHGYLNKRKIGGIQTTKVETDENKTELTTLLQELDLKTRAGEGPTKDSVKERVEVPTKKGRTGSKSEIVGGAAGSREARGGVRHRRQRTRSHV